MGITLKSYKFLLTLSVVEDIEGWIINQIAVKYDSACDQSYISCAFF